MKAQRAALRKRQLSRKRVEYERRRAKSCERGPAAPSAPAAGHSERSKVKPHRGVRTAIRGCLAKGLVEASADVPSLLSAPQRGRKPSVARVLAYTRSSSADAELNCCSQEYLDWFRRSTDI